MKTPVRIASAVRTTLQAIGPIPGAWIAGHHHADASPVRVEVQGPRAAVIDGAFRALASDPRLTCVDLSRARDGQPSRYGLRVYRTALYVTHGEGVELRTYGYPVACGEVMPSGLT